MKIEIRGYVAASDLLNSEPGIWDAIFILDSNCKLNPACQQLSKRHLALSFDDVETPRGNLVAPTERHLQEALRFAKNSSKLLVSCRAGQSRSVALGLFVTAKLYNSQQAMNLLNPARHIPNELILSLAMREIDDPDFHCLLSTWIENAQGKFDQELARQSIEELLANGATNQISIEAP